MKIGTFCYTITDKNYFPWLKNWIFYHKDRFDKLYILLLDDHRESIEICRQNHVNILVPEIDKDSWCVNHYHQIWNHAQTHMIHYGFDCWYAMIDVDEIFDIRYNPRDLAEQCVRQGNIYIWAQMINRFNLLYGNANLPEKPQDIFNYFPLEYPIHGELRHANDWKPVFRRCDMRGLHWLEHKPGQKWHDPRQFVLHHFDINSSGLETCNRKLDLLTKSNCPLKIEYVKLRNVLINGLEFDQSRITDIHKNTVEKYRYSIF